MPSGQGDEPFDVVRRVAVEDMFSVVVEVVGDEGEEPGELPGARVDVFL